MLKLRFKCVLILVSCLMALPAASFAASLTLTQPADGASTDRISPGYTGTADAGESITLTIDSGTPSEQVVLTTANAAGDWFVFGQVLVEGPHNVEASVDDANGGILTEAATFNVDVTDPDIVITSPVNGNSVPTDTPVLSGTTTTRSVIQIFEAGVPVATATPASNGDWTVSVGPLAEGFHEFEAQATDNAGNVGSAYASIWIDMTAPAVMIDGPLGGAVMTDSPLFYGRTEPGIDFEVTLDGVAVATGLADLKGAWFYVPTGLASGNHMLSVVATDLAGNGNSASVAFSYDPLLTKLTIKEPAHNTATNQLTPLVMGTTEPSGVVNVALDGGTAQAVTADTAGDWSLMLPVGSEGPHTISAEAVGVPGTTTRTSTFIIDTTPPAISLDRPIGRTDTLAPIVAGTTEPFLVVDVEMPDLNISPAFADLNGNWFFVTAAEQIKGDATITATAEDLAGNRTSVSETVMFDDSHLLAISSPVAAGTVDQASVDIQGRASPNQDVSVVVDGMPVGLATADGAGIWTIATTLTDGLHTATASLPTHSVRVDFIVDTRVSSLIITSPMPDATLSPTPTFAGAAEPGASVALELDGTALTTVVADSGGDWSFAVTAPLSEGAHSLKVTDGLGGEVTVVFTVSQPVDAPFAIDEPSDRDFTNINTPTFAGTGAAGSVVDIAIGLEPASEAGDIDYTMIGDATVANDGTWSLVADPIDDGKYRVRATQTKPDNSTQERFLILTIDTVAPEGEITRPTGGEVTSEQPPIEGTADPKVTVDIEIDDRYVGQTSSDGDGFWTFTTAAPLADGEHTLRVTLTDRAGNSRVLDALTFSSESSISSPSEGGSVSGGPASCSATAAPNASWGWLLIIGVFGFWRRRRG